MMIYFIVHNKKWTLKTRRWSLIGCYKYNDINVTTPDLLKPRMSGDGNLPRSWRWRTIWWWSGLTLVRRIAGTPSSSSMSTSRGSRRPSTHRRRGVTAGRCAPPLRRPPVFFWTRTATSTASVLRWPGVMYWNKDVYTFTFFLSIYIIPRSKNIELTTYLQNINKCTQNTITQFTVWILWV